MSAKHTPGPWYWEPGSPLITRNWNGNDSIVASVDFRLHWHEDRNCEGREQGANALLIAAAPELFGELSEILRSIEGGGNVVTFSEADVERYRALLAKATGAQS